MSEQFDFPGYHTANRDHSVRPPKCDPAAIQLLNGTRAGCNVIDISEVGATIRISDDQALPVDFELFIDPEDIARQCRLVHRADGIVVVEFIHSINATDNKGFLESMPKEALVTGVMRADHRAHKRYAVYWPAICRLISGFSWSSNVSDVSVGGMRLNNCPPLAVDDRVFVYLADVGTFSCRVAWSNALQCGMEFLPTAGELDEESVNELATSLRSLSTSVLNPST